MSRGSLTNCPVTFVVLVGCSWVYPAWSSPSIAWSGQQDVSIPIAPFGTVTTPFDVNGNSLIDFEFFSPMNDLYFTPQSGNASMVTPGLGLMPLGPGTWVGPTPDSPSTWASTSELMASYREPLTVLSNCSGPWCDAINGYMGLAFQIDGSTHYGWARMGVGFSGLTMTLHDWAYETTPGVGLEVGVIPEPTTFVLLLVGSLGLAFIRTRRDASG